MAITCNLAMTGAEIRANAALPEDLAWMACHLSPYGTGITNLPPALPRGSMLILNDRTPIHGHDPGRIAVQLQQAMRQHRCESLLLDFQRSGETETADLTRHLLEALPCPVAVSEGYAEEFDCAVFLPPVPADTSLSDHIAPWKGREIWLEAALEGKIITLTENGAASAPLPCWDAPSEGYADKDLHSHYTISLTDTHAEFTLYRTREDLDNLLAEAESLGVTRAVGLYQELGMLL